jgi:UDP-N-acetylmuramyl pentapeptide synthase
VTERTAGLDRIAARLAERGLLRGHGVPSGVQIRDVTADSRRVEPGWLFCAVAGTSGDGHRFLADVAASGRRSR